MIQTAHINIKADLGSHVYFYLGDLEWTAFS